MGLEPGSAWMDMDPGSRDQPGTEYNRVGPASGSMGAGPVLGWARSLVSPELAWS